MPCLSSNPLLNQWQTPRVLHLSSDYHIIDDPQIIAEQCSANKTYQDDGDVKVKPIETSPNLNLDIAPLLAYRPFF